MLTAVVGLMAYGIDQPREDLNPRKSAPDAT